MHIPESMLQGGICPVTAAISATGLVIAGYVGMKATRRPSAMAFGAVTALVFAGQMVNFPISNGTSGHLLGGVLAASLLGTPFGVLALAVVITLQSLLFGDGGLSVLGANLLNMALIGAGVGGLLRAALKMRGQSELVATGVAAWASVTLASVAVSVQLALDGAIAFERVLPAMLGTHALIGVGEALLTVAACTVLAATFRTFGEGAKTLAPLTASALIAFVLSPFASTSPDGLERVAAQHHFLRESAPVLAAPLPDYTVPAMAAESLMTSVAGLVGVIACFVLAWGVVRVMERTLAGGSSRAAG